MQIALSVHLFGAVIWVGGMFFAYFALRPAAGKTLAPPLRLPLWAATLQRFFAWVSLAIVLILASGIAMIMLLGGFGAVGIHVHAMLAIGVVMMAVFAHVYFAPFKKLRRNVEAQDWQAGGDALAQIRKLVALNLALGFLTIAVATLGSATP
ncbi:MAG: CopD family protein [Pseudomonadota bacterium]|nr:CopD family protein [Burkholderiales bacterium]MDQ3196008.1 CopD family protein [Pseudomonadota bacterium]